VYYEWNCLEEAEKHIREGLQDNEPWRNIMTDGFGMVALTRILQAKGDYAGAMRIVDELETRMLEPSRPREFDEDFHTLRVRVQLASGDLKNASEWADRIHRDDSFNLHKKHYRLSLARIYLALGRYTEVEALLAGSVLPASVGSQISRQLESDLLLAAAIAGQQRLEEAFTIIESSLILAEPEGYIRVFLDVGEPVRELLAAYLQSGTPDHSLYARQVLDAFSLSSQVTTSALQSAGLVEPITKRELEILQIMALGKTNREIAQQLVIAPGTVKAHAANIYRKLDVGNRTEAVTRAQQLGILA
jgi:LuxR family maltose regulon positive regulatory protein